LFFYYREGMFKNMTRYSIILNTAPARARAEAHFQQRLDSLGERVEGEAVFAYRQEATFLYISALVASVFRWLGHEEDRVQNMLFLFEMLYLSRALHLQVKDQEEGQAYDRELQLAVLLGDYYMGQALQGLIAYGAQELIPYFSRMLAVGSEGMALHFKYHHSEEETLDKTHGALYQGVFYSADRLRSSAPVEAFAQLGYHIGMAMELALRGSADRIFHQQQMKELYDLLPASHQHPELLQLMGELA
jgi:hypothetical protein